MWREGTKNYYYLDSNESEWKILTELVNLIYAGIQRTDNNNPVSENDAEPTKV